jgi:hypothetical protein
MMMIQDFVQITVHRHFEVLNICSICIFSAFCIAKLCSTQLAVETILWLLKPELFFLHIIYFTDFGRSEWLYKDTDFE